MQLRSRDCAPSQDFFEKGRAERSVARAAMQFFSVVSVEHRHRSVPAALKLESRLPRLLHYTAQ